MSDVPVEVDEGTSPSLEDQLARTASAIEKLVPILSEVLIEKANSEARANRRFRWLIVVLVLIVGGIGINNGRINSDTSNAADNAAASAASAQRILSRVDILVDDVRTLVDFVENLQESGLVNDADTQATLDSLVARIDATNRSIQCDQNDDATLNGSSEWSEFGCIGVGG